MIIEVTVDSRIRLKTPEGGWPEGFEEEIKAAFSYSNPDFFKMRAMGRYIGNTPQTITTWGDPRGELNFPRGGMDRVRKIVSAYGMKRKVIDRRVSGSIETDYVHTLPNKGRLWTHQIEALAKMLERENVLVRAPTASGKTTIGTALAAATHLPTLILADKDKLLDQWVERATTELGIREKDIGRIGGGKFLITPFTVAMPVSVVRRLSEPEAAKKICSYFGTVIVDEVQTCGAAYLWRAVDALPARHRIGISADERRKDKKEFLVHDLFGEPMHEVDREDLVDKGLVHDVEIRVVPTDFRADWYGRPEESYTLASNTDDLFESSGGSVEPEAREASLDAEEKEIDFNRLLDEMQVDEARNRLAFDAALSEIAGGHQVIMLAKRREHCHIFSRMFVANAIPSGFFIGGSDYSKEFDRTKARFRSGELKVGIGTYGALGTGIDLPKVSVGIAVPPLATNRMFFNQVRGRIARIAKGKTRAVLYVLWDQHVFGLSHLRKIVKWNPTVTVFCEGEWVTGREYLRGNRMAGRASR